MLKDPPFATWQVDELREYYRANVKPAGWKQWFRALDGSSNGIAVGPVHINKLDQIWRDLTRDMRCRFVSWNWLRPEDPVLGIDHVAKLQIAAGLDHLEKEAFCSAIKDDCEEVRRQHPKLAFWIRKRVSLLELASHHYAGLPVELHKNAQGLRQAMYNLVAVASSNPTYRKEELAIAAQRIAENALRAAAQATSIILGGVGSEGRNGCPISANLMVPVRCDADGPRCQFSPVAEDNARRAAKLWEHLDNSISSCLVTVAETSQDQHNGFWVPLVRSNSMDGQWLPGAPAAFNSQESAAVFKDDLPKLDHFSGELTKAWHDYLIGALPEKMFVSLPYFAWTDGGGIGKPLAVLNVNAATQGEHGWFRAYHIPWLEIAGREVSQFVEIAHYAVKLKAKLLPDEYQDVMPLTSDSGAGTEYRALPELPPRRHDEP